MREYERLNLSFADQWLSNTAEFWRRADRDMRRGLFLQAQQTVDDILVLTNLDPEDATVKKIIPTSFIHYVSDDTQYLPDIVRLIDGCVRADAAPATIAMLSNWVGLIHYEMDKDMGLQLATNMAEIVHESATQQSVHPWDSLCVFMAVELIGKYAPAQMQELSMACARDTNVHRITHRFMTVMEHTKSGKIWWSNLHRAHGCAPDMELPQLPDTKTSIQRTERSKQAWWRYGKEMELTQEFQWVQHWIASLVAPLRDCTYPTNEFI